MFQTTNQYIVDTVWKFNKWKIAKWNLFQPSRGRWHGRVGAQLLLHGVEVRGLLREVCAMVGMDIPWECEKFKKIYPKNDG